MTSAGRRLLWVVVSLGVLAVTAAVALAGTVSWGSAIDVPGMATMDHDHSAVHSVSCSSAGNCAAGGNYDDGSAQQAFVADETNGAWGSAIEVPGMADLNTGGSAAVNSISCPAPGNCTAGGYYSGSGNYYGGEAFVVDETNGVWGTATQPASVNVDFGTDSGVDLVSCGSPGNCAAIGYYSASTDKYGFPTDYQGFVLSETNGDWLTAEQAPSGISGKGSSYVDALSCTAVAYCVAGGRSPSGRAFLVTGKNGNWGGGSKVPGLKALSAGGASYVASVSCVSPGNCTAGGGYTYGIHDGRFHVFVVSEKNGRWGNAHQVLGGRGSAFLYSISCANAGNCAAGGWHTDSAGNSHPFVTAERNGKWGSAIAVPGLAALNVGGNAQVDSVSCASVGNCAATGFYTDGSKAYQAFVVAEQSGVWGTATEVPGTPTIPGGQAGAVSISCVGAGSCAIGGASHDSSYHYHAFVTSP